MADTTRIRHAENSTIYHRMEASGDAAEHDIATGAALASGLGSSADFQLSADADITVVDQSQLVTTIDELDAGGAATTACTAFCWIKNSGYSDAAKTSIITTVLRIHFQNSANEYISLHPKQSIMFTLPGSDLDRIDDYWASTSSGTIYAEVMCGAT
tara:strand:- start:2459 stop:2929 length:471 start_codon:yes stop_codon:yes gene_type:complete